MTNMIPTREMIKSRHINLSAWCRSHNLPYPQAYNMLKHDRIQETRSQQKIINALVADGLFVRSDDEEIAA